MLSSRLRILLSNLFCPVIGNGVISIHIIKIKSMNYAAEINHSRGANCISLRNSKYGVSILREPDYTNLDNPYLYGMPILFPVNRISGGVFEFEGRKYEFPINEPNTNCHLHGFLHQAEFELVEQGEGFVKCRYVSDALHKHFPHKFSVEVTYSLSEHGLAQETCIQNLSDTNMPNFLGFHTTFNVPFAVGTDRENIRVFAEVGDEIQREMTNYLPTGGRLANTDLSNRFNQGTFIPVGESISKHYEAVKDGKIELWDIEKGLRVRYENDEKFGWRLFYNGEANEYICLEPQTCMVNCQNLDFDRKTTGFDYIEPNSDKKYFSRISVEEMEV